MVPEGGPRLKPGATPAPSPRARIYLALLAAWMLLTFLLTSIPNPGPQAGIPYADKVAHAVLYAVTGFLCSLWRREGGLPARRAALHAVLFVSMAGAVDEVHQHWIPGRSAELLDWAADLVGGGIGAWCSVLLPGVSPSRITE